MQIQILAKTDLISLGDLPIDEIWGLLHKMWEIKRIRKEAYTRDNKHPPFYANSLKGVRPYSLFNYPSIRTIGSYSVALNEMGACCNQHFNLETIPRTYSNEKISHVARVLSGSQLPWFHLGYVRVHGSNGDHFIRKLAKHSTVPIINAMTKTFHPLQGLTDIFTLLEEWQYFEGQSIGGRQITWFGMGNNNVTHSVMLAASAVGIDFLLMCPEKEDCFPPSEVLQKIKTFSEHSGSTIMINNPAKIVNTDAVFADTHSLGDTSEEKLRSKEILAPYRVDEEKVQEIENPDWVFLHCMPIHLTQDETDYEEVSQKIADGAHSRIFPEAENRLYAIMAVLHSLTKS
ncbi:MAG: hypothetical protein F6K26_35105 [Moorea sp. SIO2I5]|nr:hypothetical protein [Moorena sp. SIO2I5]